MNRASTNTPLLLVQIEKRSIHSVPGNLGNLQPEASAVNLDLFEPGSRTNGSQEANCSPILTFFKLAM